MKPRYWIFMLTLALLLALPVSAITVIDDMDGELEMVPVLNAYGYPELYPDGTPILEQVMVQAKNEAGEPIFDESGAPVTEPSMVTNWQGAMLDRFAMAEGDGCIKAVIPGGRVSLLFDPQTETAINCEVEGEAYAFEFLFCAEAPNLLTEATLTVKDAQGGESVWIFLEQVTKSGWIRIVCRSDRAVKAEANLRALRSVQITLQSIGMNTVRIDLLRVGEPREFGVGSVQVNTSSPTCRYLEHFDGTSAVPTDGVYDGGNMVEGAGCLASVADMGLGAVGARLLLPQDLRAYAEDGWLYFWLWVDHPGQIGDARVILSSAESAEACACGYDLTEIALKRGWNEILLPLSQCEQGLGADGADCDFGNVNYFGVFSLAKEVGLRVDALMLGKGNDMIGTPSIALPVQTEPVQTDPPETAPPETAPSQTEAQQSESAEETTAPETATETEKPRSVSAGTVALWIGISVWILLLIAAVTALVINRKKGRSDREPSRTLQRR